MNAYSGARKRSVGFLVHKRWVAKTEIMFVVVTDALAYLNCIFEDIRVRFITAHLPHTGFGDDDVECGLLQLEPIIEGARRERFTVVLGIDANAVLGKRWDTDSDSVMGDYGLRKETNAGRFFVHGCTACIWQMLQASLTEIGKMYARMNS